MHTEISLSHAGSHGPRVRPSLILSIYWGLRLTLSSSLNPNRLARTRPLRLLHTPPPAPVPLAWTDSVTCWFPPPGLFPTQQPEGACSLLTDRDPPLLRAPLPPTPAKSSWQFHKRVKSASAVASSTSILPLSIHLASKGFQVRSWELDRNLCINT